MWSNNSSGGESSYNPPNKDTLDLITDDGTQLKFKGLPLQVTQVGGTVATSNLMIGGNARFSVDFTAGTIGYTTFNLWSSYNAYTLASGSINFTPSSTFNFVCYRAGLIELVTSMTSYSGVALFGVKDSIVYPFAYPLNLIGVRGGNIYNHRELSIGEWTLIGDSLTQGQSWWLNVREQFPIPIITNLAISGRKMSGASGMWLEKDNVTTTTELVTIMAGTNDQGGSITRGSILAVGSTFDTNTFIGAYQTLIEGLLARIPKLKIILMTPPRAWTDTTATTLRSGLKDYGDDVKAIGQFYNLPVVDMYNNMGYNEKNQSTFLTDGLHFNSEGYKRVANLVCGALRNF